MPVYWKKQQEDAVRDYIASDDITRNYIYTQHLHKGFAKMSEIILMRYFSGNLKSKLQWQIEDYMEDALTFAYTKIDKFDVNGSWTAFSFFQTIIKNHYHSVFSKPSASEKLNNSFASIQNYQETEQDSKLYANNTNVTEPEIEEAEEEDIEKQYDLTRLADILPANTKEEKKLANFLIQHFRKKIYSNKNSDFIELAVKHTGLPTKNIKKYINQFFKLAKLKGFRTESARSDIRDFEKKSKLKLPKSTKQVCSYKIAIAEVKAMLLYAQANGLGLSEVGKKFNRHTNFIMKRLETHKYKISKEEYDELIQLKTSVIKRKRSYTANVQMIKDMIFQAIEERKTFRAVELERGFPCDYITSYVKENRLDRVELKKLIEKHNQTMQNHDAAYDKIIAKVQYCIDHNQSLEQNGMKYNTLQKFGDKHLYPNAEKKKEINKILRQYNAHLKLSEQLLEIYKLKSYLNQCINQNLFLQDFQKMNNLSPKYFSYYLQKYKHIPEIEELVTLFHSRKSNRLVKRQKQCAVAD